ncbi:MAG: tRNA (adenosine(37)-N6)-dimethylallyltransferase MiaA [Myxococcales bacterium]|nr:tRNA (adenosine(37)-N6)-dimethylallyltransferase MiaA [Myxococcales bacterium]
MSAPPLLCIVGPTAVGKTGLAIDLCRRYGAELVGADASQVYRGMDVGTGKATPEELGEVRHHLIDVVDPDQPFDAGAFMRHADAAIADITARGKRVVVCGGTGLYLQALLRGLCDAPPTKPEIQAELRAAITAGEHAALHAELSRVDPAAAARIAPLDGQRIERALGVYRSTGRPLSAWQAEHRFAEPRYPHRILGLERPRPALNARIERRLDQMIAQGFEAEVARLVDVGYGPALRSMTALGYRHFAASAAGEMSRAEARRQTLVATRRYAKRQLTWFRRVEGVQWFTPPVDPGEIAAYVAGLWPPGAASAETNG